MRCGRSWPIGSRGHRDAGRASIAVVAAEIAPVVSPSTLVIHLAGALGLGVLGSLPCHVGALHPLQTFPPPELGARAPGRQRAPRSRVIPRGRRPRPLDRVVAVPDRRRRSSALSTRRRASRPTISSPCSPRSRRAPSVPLAAFLPLVRATVDNVVAIGPEDAFTGPVAGAMRTPSGRTSMRSRRPSAVPTWRWRAARRSSPDAIPISTARWREAGRDHRRGARALRAVAASRWGQSDSSRRWATSTTGTDR